MGTRLNCNSAAKATQAMTPYARQLIEEGVNDGLLFINGLQYACIVEKSMGKKQVRKLAELIWRLAKEASDALVLDRFNCPMWKVE